MMMVMMMVVPSPHIVSGFIFIAKVVVQNSNPDEARRGCRWPTDDAIVIFVGRILVSGERITTTAVVVSVVDCHAADPSAIEIRHRRCCRC